MPAGRPAFSPKPAQRRRVAILAAGKMSQESIANALKISVETLVKHFQHELTVGADEANSKVLAKIYEGATKGHAPQQRLWMSRQVQVVGGSSGGLKPDKPG